MAGKTLTRRLCCLMVLTLACGTLLAQNAKPRTAHINNPSRIVTPTEQSAAPLKNIFTNLGPTPTNNYNDTTGYYVLGPANSVALSEQWIGLPFTPKSNSHVSQLQVAVGWVSGTKKINVGLYDDAGGAVGNLLATAASNRIPTFGTCCTLVSVNITSTAVTAGAQYWIVVTSDDTSAPDFTGVWQSSNNANAGANVALGGWFTFSNNWPAGAAKGTVP